MFVNINKKEIIGSGKISSSQAYALMDVRDDMFYYLTISCGVSMARNSVIVL